MSRTDVPDDLAAAVRGAAHAVPAQAGDLDAVLARGRARRRHQHAAAMAGLAAVALAVGVAVTVPSALAGSERPPLAAPPTSHPPAVTEPAAPLVPVQRLLVDGGGGWARIPSTDGTQLEGALTGETTREAYQRYRQQPGAAGVFGDLAEVLPDGTAVDLDLDLPGIDGVREVVPLPDGRLVLTGTVDRMPGVERMDGLCVAGVDFPLLVVEADGTVSLTRQIRVRCQGLALVGADADTAYLLRDNRLVAHDLGTGDEQLLVDSDDLFRMGARIGVAGDRVVSVFHEGRENWAEIDCPASGPAVRIVLRVAELPSGDIAAHEVSGGSCSEEVGPVRLSPDGRHAAIAYHRGFDEDGLPSQLRVAIVELDTGARVADRAVVGPGTDRALVLDVSPRRVGFSYGAIAGLAWVDDRTLQVGWYEMPPNGVHWITDVVEVATLTVG